MKTLADLDVLQGETMYYRSCYCNEAKESKAGNDVQQQTNTVGQTSQTSKIVSPMLPSVLSIMGNQGLLARLGYSDGQISTNKVGDIINGTLKITKIGINGVQVLSLQENKFYDLKEAQN
ncbi:type IV pilus biogenesis protein PilP [Enterobacter cloacae]|uniref:type IV pilus biogenesis protein PilP n=1 Tax=Enterobacter cloacae TaxID=550 RepID=UPI00388DD272